MSYTIQSATWGDAGHTSAILQTVESGAVAVSLDRAALWLQFTEWSSTPGNTVAEFVAPDLAAEARASAKALLERLDEQARVFRAEIEVMRKAVNRAQARLDLLIAGIVANATYANLRTAANNLVALGTYTKAEVIQLLKDELDGNA